MKHRELKKVTTTNELSGYPSNLKEVYIGFEDWEELSKFVEENPEFIPIQLTKRDGQEIWTRQSQVYEQFTNGAEDYGDDYSEFDNTITEQEFIENEVRPQLEDFDDLGSLEAFVSNKKEVWDEISRLGDDEIVITYLGAYYDTIKKRSLSFSHDTRTWVIGAMSL